MCYMTRQLFPSPSQGALICAGGGEEGRLAAAPASVAAGRQDPAPHWRLDSRIRAFLRGFWTLLVICSCRQSCDYQRATELASRCSELHSLGGAGRAPSNQGVHASGSQRRAGGYLGRRKATEFHLLAWGRGRASVVVLVCSLLFLSRGPRSLFSDQRAL